MKTRITFSDITHTGNGISSLMFPLGVSYVASYSKKMFGDEVEVEVFKYPKDLEKKLDEQPPRIACFSNYSWNSNLSYDFAKRIKEKCPEIITVFGGPNYPIEIEEQEKFLFSKPALDFYICHEGEEAFSDLLKNLFEHGLNAQAVKEDNANIFNCHYVFDGKIVRGDLIPRIKNLDDIPSPMLTGLCDKFFDGMLVPLLQTARGCPFSCTFCLEGQEYSSHINRFSPERVKEEFDYIASRAKVPNLTIVDSNFGMYPQDLEICRYISESRKKYGYPKYLDTSTAKGQKERVLEAVKILGGDMNLNGSVQSTDPVVLEAIKRKNIRHEDMIELAKRGEELGASSVGEIILNLPRESKQSHFNTIFEMIDSGVNIIRVYELMPLSGSEISTNRSFSEYGLQTKSRVVARCFGRYSLYGKDFTSAEIEKICVSSRDMSYEEHKQCRSLGLTAEIFYNNGIFMELIKFLNQRNITTSSLIRRIHNDIAGSGLAPVYDSLTVKSEQDLRDNNDEAIDFFRREEKKYFSGELGNNEMLRHRALAVFRNMEEVHRIAFGSARKILSERGAFEERIESYLSELLDLSLSRKKDFILLDRVYRKKYHYDFPRLMEIHFSESPFSYSIPQGEEFEMYHSGEQKAMIAKYLEQYGTSDDGLGRLLHKSIANNLYRKIKRAGS